MSKKSCFLEGLIIGGLVGVGTSLFICQKNPGQIKEKIVEMKNKSSSLLKKIKPNNQTIEETMSDIENMFDKLTELVKEKEARKSKKRKKAS